MKFIRRYAKGHNEDGAQSTQNNHNSETLGKDEHVSKVKPADGNSSEVKEKSTIIRQRHDAPFGSEDVPTVGRGYQKFSTDNCGVVSENGKEVKESSNCQIKKENDSARPTKSSAAADCDVAPPKGVASEEVSSSFEMRREIPHDDVIPLADLKSKDYKNNRRRNMRPLTSISMSSRGKLGKLDSLQSQSSPRARFDEFRPVTQLSSPSVTNNPNEINRRYEYSRRLPRKRTDGFNRSKSLNEEEESNKGINIAKEDNNKGVDSFERQKNTTDLYRRNSVRSDEANSKTLTEKRDELLKRKIAEAQKEIERKPDISRQQSSESVKTQVTGIQTPTVQPYPMVNVAPTTWIPKAPPQPMILAPHQYNEQVLYGNNMVYCPPVMNNVIQPPVPTYPQIKVRQRSALQILNPETGEVVNREVLEPKKLRLVEIPKPPAPPAYPPVYHVMYPQNPVGNYVRSPGVLYNQLSPTASYPLNEKDDKKLRTIVVSPQHMVKCSHVLQQQRAVMNLHYQLVHLQQRLLRQKIQTSAKSGRNRIKNRPMVQTEVLLTLSEMHPYKDKMDMLMRQGSQPINRSKLRKIPNVSLESSVSAEGTKEETIPPPPETQLIAPHPMPKIETVPVPEDATTATAVATSTEKSVPDATTESTAIATDSSATTTVITSDKQPSLQRDSDIGTSEVKEPSTGVSDSGFLQEPEMLMGGYDVVHIPPLIPIESDISNGVMDLNCLLGIAFKMEVVPPNELGSFKFIPSNYALGQSHKEASQLSATSSKSSARSQRSRSFTKIKNEKWRSEALPSVVDVARVRKPKLSKEEQFTRTVRTLLNKLTVEKFLTVGEKIALLYEGLDSQDEVEIMVNLLHEKAISELEYSDMYADLAFLLKYRFNDPLDIGLKNTSFHRALLNKCQDSFESMSNTPDDQILNKDSILGNIRFMGELFLRKAIPVAILNRVSQFLLNLDVDIDNKEPSEHLVECITELLTTIGYTVEQLPGGRDMLDEYMRILANLKKSQKYTTRICFKIQDLIDLREKNWKKKVFKEKATSVAQVHIEAQQEELKGGSIHILQEGKYTTAGLQTNRHYTEYLLKRRRMALDKMVNGVYMGGTIDDQSTPIPTNNPSKRSLNVVDDIIDVFLQNPTHEKFIHEWEKCQPNDEESCNIFNIMCQKATYSKTLENAYSLMELSALLLTKIPDSAHRVSKLIELLETNFILRLKDEVLDNPNATLIFAKLLEVLFCDFTGERCSLIEKLKLPEQFSIAKELAINIINGVRNRGGEVGFARRVLKRSFYASFDHTDCIFLDEI